MYCKEEILGCCTVNQFSFFMRRNTYITGYIARTEVKDDDRNDGADAKRYSNNDQYEQLPVGLHHGSLIDYKETANSCRSSTQSQETEGRGKNVDKSSN